MKLYTWIAIKMLLSKSSHLFSLSGLNALIGLMLGVSCLVVSMAVMSGFESTLQKSVADVTGHIQIIIRSHEMQAQGKTKEELVEKIKKWEPSLIAATRFSYIEAVVAHRGQVSGIILQGLDDGDVQKVLDLQSRLVEGKFDLSNVPKDEGSDEKIAQALIGKGIAQDLGLKVGDQFRIVMPLKNDIDPSKFRRKLGSFQVSGVLDLGKHEYNQRMILTSLIATQQLAEIGNRYSGLLLKFDDINRAREISTVLGRELGLGFSVKDWREANENIFEAVDLERIIVFFVIMVIVVAAAFNVASTLYVNVVSRYTEIGLLKALGVSQKGILKIFSLQGIVIGGVGLVGGLLLGVLLCVIASWFEARYNILPGSVYKLDRIDLSVRGIDVFVISAVTLLVCFLATLAPAYRGSRLSPVEGIKND